MALPKASFWWMVPMWTGDLESGTPAGWLDGTGLSERDFFVINGKGEEFRQVIDGVLSVAKEEGWSHGEAQKAVRAVADIQLSGNLPDRESSDFLRMLRAARPRAEQSAMPGIVLSGGLIESYAVVPEGQLIRALAFPWLRFLDLLRQDPDAIYKLSPREFEELIAGSYDRAGFEVTLTPRSGDHGRDVIAVKKGFCAVRIFGRVRSALSI